MEKKYKIIVDHVGRNVVGVVTEETDTTLTINNPVMVVIQPQANNQLSVNQFPYLFFEFIDKDHRDKNEWTFNKTSIVTSNVVPSGDIISMYEKMNTPPPVVEKNPKIVSIDDI